MLCVRELNGETFVSSLFVFPLFPLPFIFSLGPLGGGFSVRFILSRLVYVSFQVKPRVPCEICVPSRRVQRMDLCETIEERSVKFRCPCVNALGKFDLAKFIVPPRFVSLFHRPTKLSAKFVFCNCKRDRFIYPLQIFNSHTLFQ